MNNVGKILMTSLFLLASHNLGAKEIAGFTVPEQAELAGQTIALNGAGIRTKFVFDIYVGALYLPKKATDTKQALAMAGPKRVLMRFIYDELAREKLTDGWTEGFENNLTEQDFNTLKARLVDFNKLFINVKRGDTILLDYLPATGTQVIINDDTRGTIPGEDFYRALLLVWLGEDPADSDLKSAMLGQQPS